MTHYQSYIICTTPRSGSTLLCRLLAATNVSGKPDSHFHQPSIVAWMRYYGITSDAYDNERDLITAIFRSARARGTGNTDVFGLRLQIDSLTYFLEKLRIVCLDGKSGVDSDCIQSQFGRTLFIHLTRINKVEQAVSLDKALQTGLWHRAPDGTELERTSAAAKPIFNAESIEQHIAKLTAAESQWQSWFTQQGIEPLRICYEDLSDDHITVLAMILKQLGLDSRKAQDIQLPVAKLADATNAEWIERFYRKLGVSNSD